MIIENLKDFWSDNLSQKQREIIIRHAIEEIEKLRRQHDERLQWLDELRNLARKLRDL